MMPAFKDFLVKDTDKWTLEEKRNILRMLKFEPEKVVQIVAQHLEDWGTQYIALTGKIAACYDNSGDDPKELVEAWKEKYATELAAIT